VSGVALAAPLAAAHVAPAQDENNRYLKILPFADRVRLAYTVFYGEVPGHALRQTLDVDRDGTISDAESRRFGDRLAAQIAAGLELEIDGVRQAITWDEVSVGMGTPATTAGAWSVDLIAWPCVAADVVGVHRLRLRDRVDLPQPGETELWVVDMPGVAIQRARVGAVADPGHDFRFSGALRELATDGLELAYTADPHVGTGSAGACSAGAAPGGGRGGSRVAMIVAAAVGGALGLGAMAWTRRRRRPQPEVARPR